MSQPPSPSPSKEQILAALRRNRPPVAVLPELSGPWIRYPDPLQQFVEALQGVGGRCRQVSRGELHATVEQMLDQSGADRASCCSIVDDLRIGGVVLANVKRPHDLANLQWMFASGRLAVAENGAVWVEGGDLQPHRVALFLAQHLALVVPKSQIVSNMHEAYERIRCDQSEFGVFVSGPSKTADIEQSLVIGAHGPKTLTVLLVEDSAA